MKPIQLVYPVILFAIGTPALLREGAWFYFGVAMWIMAGVSFVWLLIGGIMAERARYYDSVSDALHEAKDCDLEKLAALGLSSHEIKESLHVDLHEGARSRHFDLGVSSVKLQPLAAGLLSGQPFSERRWANLLTSSEFRTLRQVMRSKGLIQQVSEADPRQGFILTQAGRALMNSLTSPTPPMSQP